MTICIAAGCNHSRDGGPKIISCTDWKQSSAIGSADTVHKQAWLPENWICLTAGNTTEINALVRIMRAKFFTEDNIDETNVIQIVQDSLRERLMEKRDEYTYGEFSRSYDEVFNKGKDTLPQSEFSKFMQESSQIDLGAELIVAGFTGTDSFIIETTKKGNIKLPTDYSCIGEGKYLAQASLLQRDYSDVASFGSALYYVYEAKKAAEGVSSVGETTLIKVLNEDGTDRHMKQGKYDYLDGLYNKYGPQLVPILLDVPDDLFD